MAVKKELNVFQKLAEARSIIANTKVKKKGRNTFSKYDYFTPDQIHQLTGDACSQVGLLTVYSLERNELEHTGTLDIINIDKPEETITVVQSTAIPDIKATNVAQKIGGTITYSNRYLLMTAFNISDNSLDFDATENTPKPTKKAPAPVSKKEIKAYEDENYKKAISWAKAKGKTVEDMKKFFIFNGDMEKSLIAELQL